MKVLVTGGAGYIGSFMSRALIEARHDVTVADSLEEGHKEALPSDVEFVQGNLLEKGFVRSLFVKPFDAVFHFAAYISMKESMEKPGKYFQNNVQAAINLLDVMADMKTSAFIFSSTAGVYGNPETVPISEDHPKRPTNPYGQSKYIVEQVLPWYAKIHAVGSVSLRYFNAAGAALDGSNGEAHRHETHIIPNVIKAVLSDGVFPLYGSDYETPDGTCIRDYIHVLDLVQAHLLALDALQRKKGEALVYNVGTGTGYSNKEIVQMVERVAGKKVSVSMKDPRPGDASSLVADVTKIKQELQFQDKYSDLQTIVETAWKWHSTRWEKGIR